MTRKSSADLPLRLDNQICIALYSAAHAFNRVYKPQLDKLTPLLKRMEAAALVKRTRSTEDERQVLIALTPKGEALREKARAVPESILAASACSVGELVASKNEIVALRDRLIKVLGE